MSKHESTLDLPALTAGESGGNMTDSSTIMNNERSQQQQQQQQQQPPAQEFMDSNFFYSLDQLSPDNPLFFMQQQSQHHFGNQFLKEQQQHANGESSSNNNQLQTSSMAQSIATSMESFQQAITSSVGEQPPSFWTGLNNFISNVTHNNIFPTFPNIARSFSEYLEKHPVPFLSSFNAPTASPISSPMPSNNMDFDPMLQFKQGHEQSNTGLQIRVLGVPQTGAKSRVETQIKLCIQLVTDGGDKAQWWSHLKLPEQMVTKDKLKKPSTSNNGRASLASAEDQPEKALYLQARVLCASDPSKKVVTCISCIQRERKRSQRRKENKPETLDGAGEDDLASDEERILLFNCSEIVDFSAGDTILPTRITCYCRHHNERVGFCIYFEMLDHTGKKVAEGLSPPILITDDHKSNKVKAGSKRRRTTNDTGCEIVAAALPPALSEGGINALNWIKSFQFGNSSYAEPKVENQDNYPPISSASSTASESNNMKPSIMTPTHQTQQFLFPVPAQQQNQQSQQQQYQLRQPLTLQQQQLQQAPVMKRLIPNEGPSSGGIEITILGVDFRPGLTVMFGDKPATNIQYWSPNTLICTLPAATQPGAVVVSFKESPPANKTDVMVFTHLVETDRALMELALQVVGMKMTGIVEDARKIAMRIVQGNTGGNPPAAIKSEQQDQQQQLTLPSHHNLS